MTENLIPNGPVFLLRRPVTALAPEFAVGRERSGGLRRVRLATLTVTAWQELAARDTSGGASAEVVSHSSGSNRAQVSLCFRQLENSTGPSLSAAQRHRSLAGQAR
jgi:hypothetical protein